jgi:hypothetical protein
MKPKIIATKQARGVAGGMIAAWSLGSFAMAAAPASLGTESQYAAGMHQIMERMSADMTMTPNDAVDRQFITLMIPHHQAAIDMAQLQLRSRASRRRRPTSSRSHLTPTAAARWSRLPPSTPTPPALRLSTRRGPYGSSCTWVPT